MTSNNYSEYLKKEPLVFTRTNSSTPKDNKYFKDFVKKTSPLISVHDALGLNNKILCPNSCQRSNWSVPDLLCGRKTEDVSFIQTQDLNYLASNNCNASCSSGDSDISTKDLLVSTVLNNPQILAEGANILGELFTGIKSFFGFGSEEQTTEKTVKLGNQEIKVGQKGIFDIGNGQIIQGVLNQDGTVTSDDGKTYKPTAYNGPLVNARQGQVQGPVQGPSNPQPTNTSTTTTLGALSETLDAQTTDKTDKYSVANEEAAKNAETALSEYKDAIKTKDEKKINEAKNKVGAAISGINEEIKTLKDELSTTISEISTKESKIAEKEKEALENKQQLEGAKADRTSAQNAINNTKTNITNKNNEITTETQRLTRKVTEAEKNVSDLKEKITQAKPEEKEALEAQLKEAEKKLSAAKQEKEDTLKKLNNELKELKSMLKEQEEKLQKKEEEIKRLEGASSSLSKIKEALIEHKKELEEKLSQYEEKKLELERAAAEQGHEFENLKNEESKLGTKTE